MKTCFKCGQQKPLDEFYRHPQMADGRLNKCKDCTRDDVGRHRALRHDEFLAYDRKRSRMPKRREDLARNSRQFREQYPEKYRAHNLVASALKCRRLQKHPCERCGRPEVEAHHDDYSRPLDVMWLCVTHHKERHAELRSL